MNQPAAMFAGPGQAYLQLRIMGDRWLPVLGRHDDLKDTELILGHGSGVAVPVVEVANQVCAQGIGRPLAVHNVAVVAHVEAVLFKPLRQPLAVLYPKGEVRARLALVNLSKPPSESWMVLSHCCAFA